MRKFWEKGLAELTAAEWEALCDHCGRCCLVKLEDEDSGEIFTTRVACALYDIRRGGCRAYGERHARMPDCLRLTPESIGRIPWLPESCAYRRVHEGRPLPAWHPLVCGDPLGPEKAGAAIRGRVISEALVPEEDLPHYMADWPEPDDAPPPAADNAHAVSTRRGNDESAAAEGAKRAEEPSRAPAPSSRR